MDGDEDDYLSDKFLAATTAPAKSAPRTYQQRRREAQRVSEIKNLQGRKKGRKELEEESRKEGLSKSLFERAKEEEDSGLVVENKAMAMMMRMGFKPGQSLGKVAEPALPLKELATTTVKDAVDEEESSTKTDNDESTAAEPVPHAVKHLVEPLPLSVWAGRKGVGLGTKRARSPDTAAAGPSSKTAKVIGFEGGVPESKEDYQKRTREEYEERRAEGRLVSATRTCITLDDKAGREFNILWTNPHDAETVPMDLLEKLQAYALPATQVKNAAAAAQLRAQMQADALQPLTGSDAYDAPEDDKATSKKGSDAAVIPFTDELVEKAYVFLRSTAPERLAEVIGYLRTTYHYCFWCGAEYESAPELAKLCPGVDEDAHD